MVQSKEQAEVIDRLLTGMGDFFSTKTVMGSPVDVGETTIIPLMDVSFGMGIGTGAEEKKNSGCGGIGGKMSPSAVLVVSGGRVRLVNIKNQDSVTKILDMVPGIIDRFTVPKGGEIITDSEAVDIAFDKTENK
ncbi:MAG: GerW family sporulation protein [Lachnospiraceae bacterium]|nr:GerW family sporulation protein [Lachnospiraceae bacterium]